MRVLLLAQYFKPETVGAAIWIHQLAVDLVNRGHEVTIITGFPNIPYGIVFNEYRRRLLQREWIDGVEVVRTYLYTSPNRNFMAKLLNFATFSVTAGVGGVIARRPDVVYAILPPLPLGITASILGLIRRVPVIVNIQDIWPDAPAAAGLLRNSSAVRVFEGMESVVYQFASRITVISESFRKRLCEKGVPWQKIVVIPNWADPTQIRPGTRNNSLRRELGVGPDEMLVIYSGALSHNSCLDTMIDAAHIARDAPFKLVIVGEGVKSPALLRQASGYGLKNVRFLPWQPLDRYADVLAAADMSVVALHKAFTFSSVPSKTFKIMASGRPILALADEHSEICSLVRAGHCGFCVPPDDPLKAADALRYAIDHRSELDQLGANGRRYLEQHFSREMVISQLESLLLSVADEWAGSGTTRRDSRCRNECNTPIQ